MPRTILVIDDEDSIRQVLKDSLETAGYAVATAADAPSGIAAARQIKPDLILLDMQMPGGGGEGVFAALNADALTRDIGIFFTTGLKVDEVQKRIPASSQCLGYFQKPFQLEFLLKRVAGVLATDGP